MPPNILYIHSHDTGRYVQPYGHAIPTPNIQWLADQGIMSRNAFCAAPSCPGSRAALLTGEYCHTNGMMGLAHRGFALNDYHHQHSAGPAAIESLRSGIREPFFMSVGFFETHRSFFEPSSVRDRVYSLPPPFLPDMPEIREDIAAHKASARALDHGVGSVLNALRETGLEERTLVIFTTDHGLAFPTAKASLPDRGIGVSLIVRGPGFTGGRAVDALVSQVDIFPTVCEVAGIPVPPWALGRSLVGLVAGEEDPGVPSEIFSELTYHAAYEPQRAIRTELYKYTRRFDDCPCPVLANCDDSPSKEAYIARGWSTRKVARESLHEPFFNPGEGRNLIDSGDYADILADLRERLHRWMVETEDPLLDGPIAPPPGALVNSPPQWSAEEPTQLEELTRSQ